jgi:hypothetical protein
MEVLPYEGADAHCAVLIAELEDRLPSTGPPSYDVSEFRTP